MRVSYVVGWILLLAAFVSAAAEVLVKSTRGSSQVFVAAHDLLYTIWPSGLLILQIRMENIVPNLWDPWVLAILTMPAWAIFGGPGFLFIILFRPRRPGYHKRLEEARQQEQQLLLYDKLAKEAQVRGINPQEDDMRPDHSGHEVLLKASQDNIDDKSESYNFVGNRLNKRKQKQTSLLLKTESKKLRDSTPPDQHNMS